MRSIKLAVYKMNTRGSVQTPVALQTGQLVLLYHYLKYAIVIGPTHVTSQYLYSVDRRPSGTALDTLHTARQ